MTHTPPASRRTRWARTVLLGLASLKRNSICHLAGRFLYGWTWAGACFVSTSFGQSAKPSLGALLRVRVRKCLERFLGLTFYSGDILSAAPLRFVGLQILSGFILSSWPFISILSAPFYLKTPLHFFRYNFIWLQITSPAIRVKILSGTILSEISSTKL